jgi:hypothetical protein
MVETQSGLVYADKEVLIHHSYPCQISSFPYANLLEGIKAM